MAQSLKPSLWPLVTGIYPIPSAGSVYDDLVLFLHAFTPLITFGLICNSFRFACFVNSSLRFLIPNLHPICTCSCLFTPLTEGRSARDLTQAATSQKKQIAAQENTAESVKWQSDSQNGEWSLEDQNENHHDDHTDSSHRLWRRYYNYEEQDDWNWNQWDWRLTSADNRNSYRQERRRSTQARFWTPPLDAPCQWV